MAEINPLQPGQRFGGGRYVLIRLLGRGGMGEVWLARDERLEQQVALKFLAAKVRENSPALDHLRLEAARSRRLTHPNIVRLYDFHEPPGEPAFLSIEYVEGSSLNALRFGSEKRVLTWEYLRGFLAQLCAALEYAHAENVIHRDIKPDNILIDSRGRLKLTDFGLAAMTTDLARSGSGHGGGTLNYMSPQQLEGKHPQATDDIYAVGATLYELLTGETPFCSGDIARQILHEQAEPLRQRLERLGIENDVPSDVAAMIMSCLGKDPEQRPPNAQSVASWLSPPNEVAASNEPPAAPAADIAPTRASTKIIWAAVVLILLLTLGGGLLWKMHGPRAAAAAAPVSHFPAHERWTNSLGMIFVPVPECEPLFCIWKTRVQDYQAMVDATGRAWEKPSFPQEPTHPAVNIKWDDAVAFCDWLTARDRATNIIASNQYYRLPSDAEWSLAVGLRREPGKTPKERDSRTPGVFPWGTEYPPPPGTGNFDPKLHADEFPYTSPVGSFPSNAFGLFDMAGNAREWCEDRYAPGSERRVVRGSSWFDTPAVTLLSSRRALTPAERGDDRYDYFGFRCVLVTSPDNGPARARADAAPAPETPAAPTPQEPPPQQPVVTSPTSPTPNTLTAEEIAAGWKLLFDGRTTTGWRGYKMTGFPTRGWHIADGCLVNPKSNGRPNGSGGDIITVQKFLNFDFRFEWRIGHGGNSGVQYFFDEHRSRTPVPMYGGDVGNSPMGFEYQILDDPNYDRELRNGPKHLTAALYMLVEPTNKFLRPAGEFNEGRIIVNGRHVEHWLNGRRVLECELESPSLLQAIAETKFKWIAGLGHKSATQFALQDHGDDVAFRNLKIRELHPPQ
jgi:hypothetical protein